MGGRLFEAGRLLTFSAFRMGAYSRWALIRGWALTRINTVVRGVNFKRLIYMCIAGGRTPHMKGVGMLIVSLRGVNFGFWSHSGFSGQNAIIFGREGLVWGRTRKI